jgi:hypothetical protein
MESQGDSANTLVEDVGNSMTQRGKRKNVSRDMQAVFQIASQLLNLNSSTDTTSMSWIIAKNFVTMPSTVDPRTLLKIRILCEDYRSMELMTA